MIRSRFTTTLLTLVFIGTLAGALVWAARERLLARELALVLGEETAAPQTGGSSPDGEIVRREEPVSFESRVAAAEFLPTRLPDSFNFALTTAHASVILDADSGTVLYQNRSDEQRQIASLTKMMTAMLTVERVKDLDEWVTIDEEVLRADGTRVGCPRSGFCNGEPMVPGEQVRVRDLLKAAMMNSANDAATALGKHVGGGSLSAFVDIMNRRAEELGLQHTHFCTPSGLEIDGQEAQCYSSAYDIARITAHALRYDVLWDIMRLPETTIVSRSGRFTHEIFNTNQLLGIYPQLVGTKTGFTPLAGYSLVAVAYDPSYRHRVVAVVLDDPFRWGSVRQMFDWTFQSHEWR